MQTIAQMRAGGASRKEIEKTRKASKRVRLGVYTDVIDDDWELYRLRCLAVSRAITGAVLAGPSAAMLLGLTLVDSPPELVYIRGVTRGTYGSDVRVLIGGTPDIVHVDGVAVTSAAWTVVDCARTMSRRDALIIADNALHLGVCTKGDLTEASSSLGPVRRISHVRWAILNADGRSESPGETWLRMIVRDFGLDVTPQVELRDGEFTARVDLLVNGRRVVLEFDGLMKYRKQDPRLVEMAIKAERGRQARLERMGYLVLRFIWDQLLGPLDVEVRIRKAVQRSVGS